VTEISFFCAGTPVQQGSMRAVTRPGSTFAQLVSDNKGELHPWRTKIAQLAIAASIGTDWPMGYNGAVHLTCRFLLPMPATRPAAVRKRGIGLCTVTPDLDKLLRAIGDGLTESGVIADDARIVKGGQVKYEVADHRYCGAEILLRTIDLNDEYQAMVDLLDRRQRYYSPLSGTTGRRSPAR
jgi:Holliday junction resolvase RusA-like endonuclease